MRVTYLQDLGLLLCNSGLLAYATLIFRKHSELVGVAHDEVGDGGVHSVVVIQHGEPVLWAQSRSRFLRIYGAKILSHLLGLKFAPETENSLRFFCRPSGPCNP